MAKIDNELQFPVKIIFKICKDLIFRIINKHANLADIKSIQNCLNMCQMESKDTKYYKTTATKIKIAFYSIENSINKEV